jgi:2-deoxy-D-gluconate 3-dehydrogenase
MLARRAGKIINIVSEYSIFGAPLVPSYGAAKGALMQLTKSLAIELAPYNIQVNAILPGWFNTDLTQPLKTQLTKPVQTKSSPERPLGFGAHQD